MKNHMKRFMVLLLTLAMVFSILPETAFAAGNTVASGTCGASGDNAIWVLDDSGTLTISGTGEMADYSDNTNVASKAPWSNYADDVKNVVVEMGISSIGAYAFYRCTALETVSLPDTIRNIRKDAFCSCNSLWDINFPENLEKIDFRAFAGCNLKSIDIPSGRIVRDAFANNKLLTSVYLGANVSGWSVDDQYGLGGSSETTYGCSSLKSINVDSDNPIFSSKDGILFDKNKERLIRCPEGFQYSTIIVPDSVIVINQEAFVHCTSLEKVVVSQNTTTIGMYAFSDCSSLTSLDLPASITTLEGAAFEKCTNLTEISLPNSISTIPTDAFYGCTSLVDVSLPTGTSVIGSGAFQGSGLESITIPANVTSIYQRAFYCENLQTVWFRGNAPTLISSNNAFYNNSNAGTSRTIYYPENDSTWTDEVKQKIAGNNEWIPYTPIKIDISELDVIINSPDSCVYNGKEHKPGVTVKAGYDVLAEGVDYSISYENNIYPGVATAIITGCGEYTGSVTRTFTIDKGVLRATVKSYSGTYNGSVHTFMEPVITMAASGTTTVYYSTVQELTQENYLNAGSTTRPVRTNPGTTVVYYYITDDQGYCYPVMGSTFIAVKPQCTVAGYSGTYDGSEHTVSAGYSAGATIYFSTEKELDINNYQTDGTSEIPQRTSAGTTTVYYLAVPDSNADENSVVSGSTTIIIDKAEPDLTVWSSANPIEVGEKAWIMASTGVVGALRYSSANANIASVSQEGEVTGISAGTTTITVSLDETSNYQSISREIEITVTGGQTSGKTLGDCTITLGENTLVYNGKSQCPSITVRDGETILNEDTDYRVTRPAAINAGTYQLTIEGIGQYTGSKTVNFSIIPIDPVLSFEKTSIEKMVTDSPFVNTLTAQTDGTITYSSGNTAIATVDPSTGQVTIVSTGTTVITANAAAGRNYLQGETSYTLTVAEEEKTLSIDTLSYSFENKANAFDYPSGYHIQLNIFEKIFGQTTKAKTLYLEKSQGRRWSGNCAGFSSTSALMSDPDFKGYIKAFNSAAEAVKDLTPAQSGSMDMSVRDFIESLQISQYTQLFRNALTENLVDTRTQLRKGTGNLNKLARIVKSETEEGRPVVLTLYQKGLGHAVLAYAAEDISGTQCVISLYDSNYPLEERQLTLTKDEDGDFMEWSYEIGSSYGVWGTHELTSSIGYVPYSVIKEIWTTRGRLQENENIVSINSDSVAIYNGSDKPVATVTQGTLSSTLDNIRIINDLSLEANDNDTILISVPTDVYTFENLDKSVETFTVAVTNTNLGASASTTADEITIAVDDSCNLNSVYIDAGENDTYSITLNSTFSYDHDDVTVSGTGSGEQLEVSQSKGNINISNCNIISITVDGEEQYSQSELTAENTEVTLSAASLAYTGKALKQTVTVMFTPAGEAEPLTLVNNTDYTVTYKDNTNVGTATITITGKGAYSGTITTTFKITQASVSKATITGVASKAYTGKALTQTPVVKVGTRTLVSGTDYTVTYKNNTNVGTATMTVKGKGNYSGTITKEFAITPKKVTPTVTLSATSYTWDGKVKKPTVTVKAGTKTLTTDDYTVTYASGRKNVGKYSVKVTLKGNYTGSKTVYFTIVPKGTTLKTLTPGSKKVTVRWTKQATKMSSSVITGYEIQLATNSKFTTGKKTVTVSGYGKVSKVVSSLKGSQKYYVRIRTYKTVSGVKYYSPWSAVKSVTTRK